MHRNNCKHRKISQVFSRSLYMSLKYIEISSFTLLLTNDQKCPMAVSIWHQQTIKYIKIENQKKNKCYHTSPGFLTVKIYLYSEQSGSVPGTRTMATLNLTTAQVYLLPLLLTWIDFNPSLDKLLHPSWNVGWNYLSIPKLQWWNCWSLGMDK